MSKKNQKLKDNETSKSVFQTIGIVLFWIFLKIPYYIFLWFCYLLIFANSAALIAGLITGDSYGLEGTIGSIILASIVLLILSFFTKKMVRHTFEFFMFGNYFGFPAGILLITGLILAVLASLLKSIHIEINTFILIVLVIVSLILSFPVFKEFTKWYVKNKKEDESKKSKKEAS